MSDARQDDAGQRGDRVIAAIQSLSDQIAVGGSSVDRVHEKLQEIIEDLQRLKHLIDGNGEEGMRTRLREVEKRLEEARFVAMRAELDSVLAWRELLRWWFQTIARAVVGVLVVGALGLVYAAMVYFGGSGGG